MVIKSFRHRGHGEILPHRIESGDSTSARR